MLEAWKDDKAWQEVQSYGKHAPLYSTENLFGSGHLFTWKWKLIHVLVLDDSPVAYDKSSHLFYNSSCYVASSEGI